MLTQDRPYDRGWGLRPSGPRSQDLGRDRQTSGRWRGKWNGGREPWTSGHGLEKWNKSPAPCTHRVGSARGELDHDRRTSNFGSGLASAAVDGWNHDGAERNAVAGALSDARRSGG